MNGQAVGRRMAALRRSRGLTRREFAELTRLSQGQLSRLENGRQGFRSETLIRVAEALRVEPYRLFLPGDGDPPPARTPTTGRRLRHAGTEPWKEKRCGVPRGEGPAGEEEPATGGERVRPESRTRPRGTSADAAATAADRPALNEALNEVLDEVLNEALDEAPSDAPNEALKETLDGELLEALRAPDFVSLLENIARARRTSPATFVAVRSVVAAVLGR